VDGETALEVIAADSIRCHYPGRHAPGAGWIFGRGGATGANRISVPHPHAPLRRGRPEDVLNGFSAGADDYLPKPFDLAILLARLNGLLRRMAWLQPGVRRRRSSHRAALSRFLPSPLPGSYTIDFASLELTTPSKNVRLTLMECDLLSLPGAQPGAHYLPQGVVGTGLAGTRGYGYARHRQLHGFVCAVTLKTIPPSLFSRDLRGWLSFPARRGWSNWLIARP